MEVTGKIKVINETESVGATFKKRGLVVTTDEQYPQMIMIEFVQDKCDLLNAYKEGQDVKVSINLRGREWINPEGVAKYFNSIQGWRIESVLNEDIEGKFESFKEERIKDVKQSEPDDLPF